MSDFKLVVTEHEMLDTGIGREAGYESDQAMREADAAELAALPRDVQDAVKAVRRDVLRAVMFGPPEN